MKNIHILPTDKPSRLFLNKINNKLLLDSDTYSDLEKILPSSKYQHIYITSDEEIKEGDWYYYFGHIVKYDSDENTLTPNCKKINLTTDQDLIKDGVQAIDDEFLEWFVKNPSCEKVEVGETYPLNCCIQKEGKTKMNNGCMERNRCLNYKIIIPKEEQCTCKEHDPYCCQIHGNCPTCVKKEKPKQETPEEAAERLYPIPKGGSIWNPSEDDCIKANKQEGFIEGTKWQAERRYSEEEVLNILQEFKRYLSFGDEISQAEWFEQFKRK